MQSSNMMEVRLLGFGKKETYQMSEGEEEVGQDDKGKLKEEDEELGKPSPWIGERLPTMGIQGEMERNKRKMEEKE